MSSLVVRVGEGPAVTLYPGDVIGRLRTAALRVDDPRVSEAHAMVSLRDGELQLLALRGVLALERQRCGELVLTPGQQVRLAKDLYLDVISVDLADEALGVAIDDLPAQLLLGSSASLLFDPAPGLVRPYRRDAAALLWSDGLGWRVQVPGQEPVAFAPGVEIEVDGHTLRAEMISLHRAGTDATALGGRVHPPLRIVSNYDTAHIHRPGLEPVTLAGIAARILGELVALGGPATWEAVAQEIWRDDTDLNRLRHRWDVSLGRLRSKLEEHGVRRSLILSDGTGQIELMLMAGDTVEDNT